MKFMLLVVVLDQSAPNYMHAHYDSYAACVAGFQEVSSRHPIKVSCAAQVDYVALVVKNLDDGKEIQHSVHYSYADCRQATRELKLNYDYAPRCTQYQ